MKRYENEGTINSIDVEDIDVAIKCVADNGGKVVKPKVAMPLGDDTMFWAYLADPGGNVFGVNQLIKTLSNLVSQPPLDYTAGKWRL